MTDISRRDALAALAGASVTGLAGCVEDMLRANDSLDSDDSEGDSGGDTDDDDDQSGDSEITVLDIAIDTLGTNCLQPDDPTTAIEVLDNAVKISGTISAPNPCHVAVADATVEESTLTVDIDVEPENADTDCIQCVGSVEYEARVDLSAAIQTVEVNHVDDDVQVSVDADETPKSEPEPTVDDVETLETDCSTGDETADATIDDDTLTVEGVIGAPDPCHAAEVVDLVHEDGELTVVVDVESTLDEGEMCQQCLGAVRYEASIDLDGAELERVRVDHESGDRHTVSFE